MMSEDLTKEEMIDFGNASDSDGITPEEVGIVLRAILMATNSLSYEPPLLDPVSLYQPSCNFSNFIDGSVDENVSVRMKCETSMGNMIFIKIAADIARKYLDKRYLELMDSENQSNAT